MFSLSEGYLRIYLNEVKSFQIFYKTVIFEKPTLEVVKALEIKETAVFIPAV